MNILSIGLLSVAMAADAFAAAISQGIALRTPTARDALRHGLVFGAIAAAMPLCGWALGSLAGAWVVDWDHWIAFALLSALGASMVVKAIRPPSLDSRPAGREPLATLAAAGVATSIDAFAAGVGLAFVESRMVEISLAIGLTTGVAVTVGVLLGRQLGKTMGRAAETAGGLILIGIGASILIQHTGA